MSKHVKINNRTAVMTRERYDALATDFSRTLDVVNTAKKEGFDVHGATELQADADTVSFALAFYREADPVDGDEVEELTEAEEAALLAILGEPDADPATVDFLVLTEKEAALFAAVEAEDSAVTAVTASRLVSVTLTTDDDGVTTADKAPHNEGEGVANGSLEL